MITINDDDLPIVVAEKIITATKPYNPTPMMKMLCANLTGKESAADAIDMFDLTDLKEIAGYILTYCKYHDEVE